MSYVNPNSQYFTVIDRIISLSDAQEEILLQPPPLILLGSAGCGKTILALQMVRQTEGRVLFTTLSPFLVKKAASLYAEIGQEPEDPVVDFLPFGEFLQQLTHRQGREVGFDEFKQWFARIRNTSRIKDAHKLFEEIRGVITGSSTDKPYLSKEEYLALGVRQSVFSAGEKELVYPIFLRYLEWLKQEKIFDANIAAFEGHAKAQPLYDLIVVDEVQDMTNVQLQLLLKSMRCPGQFIFCGDANQVVHPNFFSWANVKRMLHQQGLQKEIIRLIPGNYRNPRQVNDLANRVLALKNARFGATDKPIAQADAFCSDEEGIAFFVEDSPAVRQEIASLLKRSATVAVVVLREEDKAAAMAVFQSPLIFTVHEAKGLEYDHIVLYNVISDHAAAFAEICEGIAPRNINHELVYSRPKNKEDRSLQSLRFYINALYVAMTRSINGLFIVERDKKHRLLSLLGAKHLRKTITLQYLPLSSIEDWAKEADRLEIFGRKEQAEAIRSQFGNFVEPDWEVTNLQKYWELRAKVLLFKGFNMRDKVKLYEFALIYYDWLAVAILSRAGYKTFIRAINDRPRILNRILAPYKHDEVHKIEPLVKKYGPDFRNEFNFTPLMLAVMAGATKIARYLRLAGADPLKSDNWGRTAFQLAIVHAYFDDAYAANTFQEMARLAQPPCVHVRVTDFKDFALPLGTMAFAVTTIILALQREFLHHKRKTEHIGIHVDDFVKVIQLLPEEMLPAEHRKREYISSFLARYEFFEHRSIFLVRLRKGYYTLCINHEIIVDGSWVSLARIIDLPELAALEIYPGIANFRKDIGIWVKKVEGIVERLTDELEQEKAGMEGSPDENLRDWPA